MNLKISLIIMYCISEKTVFKTFDLAKDRADYVNAKLIKQKQARRSKAYKCPSCDFYHLTSIKKNVTEQQLQAEKHEKFIEEETNFYNRKIKREKPAKKPIGKMRGNK